MRKLTVKNFSVIKEAELEFGKITVLIGPQSSGKSLLCKLAYFFEQRVSEILYEGLRSEASLSQTEESIIRSFLTYFPIDDIEKERFHITYQAHASISVSIGMSDAWPSPYLQWKDRNFIHSFKKWQFNDPKRPPSYISDRRRGFLSGADIGPLPIESDSVYVPTGRSFFSTPNRAFAALSLKNLDWITNRFATEFDADYRDLLESYQSNRTQLSNVGSSSVEILKGRVVNQNSRLLFESNNDNKRRPFEILSSGTLELLPVLNVLAQIAKKTGDPVHPHMPSPPVGMVFVEEPELSVFPDTQYEVVKLVASLARSESIWKCYSLTTHSPYILSSFTNLLEAWQTGHMDEERAKAVRAVIDEKYWVNPDEFRAYSIDEGYLKSIMDEETHLISDNFLDSVSERIGGEFDELLRIGYVDA